MAKPIDTADKALHDDNVKEAIARSIFEIQDNRITYHIKHKKQYQWSDPEEWVRARIVAYLVVEKSYPSSRMMTEVQVPNRVPGNLADVVVYEDDRCKEPYLVVETKAAGQTERDRKQGIEQGFGNANALRAAFVAYDEHLFSSCYDVANFGALERLENRLGTRDAIPKQYGRTPTYRYVADGAQDITACSSEQLALKIRRAHSIIWAGGKRDPLTAFDEWSKILFAKIIDERRTPTGKPRKFQAGHGETVEAVANRVRALFICGCLDDPSIFSAGTRLGLSDGKIHEVVKTVEDVSFMRTDVDSVGMAFEGFFGTVFRGELGQYFTMRQLVRFTVAMLDISHEDYVIDPTAGSGGFLLEALLQVWHRIDREYGGSSDLERERLKIDFAQRRVYGIEIHETLSRICKINLLLHHDGHTNIEADCSCLDAAFTLPRLDSPQLGQFTSLMGNPPFGDRVEEGDQDHLGTNTLDTFTIAEGRNTVASEHAILERSINFLSGGGRLGLVVPDGLLNNQGAQSNCPQMRMLLAKNGFIEAIVSLPDYAFRRSGAQNKTSILFFRKFSARERKTFEALYEQAVADGGREENAISKAFENFNHYVFLAEANFIGYKPTGAPSDRNDLYVANQSGHLEEGQQGTILGEYRRFQDNPHRYVGSTSPDCMSYSFVELWQAHESHRFDPKYFLFKREEAATAPDGWIKCAMRDVMLKRKDVVFPGKEPDRPVLVMTLSQTGEIRQREAGKGKNPPEWVGAYFQDGARWYAAHEGDIVFSQIDLWKGCIAVVPKKFDGALVTAEFPIYNVTDERIDPEFLSCLLRSRYFQRAFKAIATGHSNRRRTQDVDFAGLDVFFPPSLAEQRRLIVAIQAARSDQRRAAQSLCGALMNFNDVIDGRGSEELPALETAQDNE